MTGYTSAYLNYKFCRVSHKVLVVFIQPFVNVFPFKRWKVMPRFMEFVMPYIMPIILHDQPFL
jgi:hypothetical protein